MNGKIKFFNAKNHFGFIKAEDGNEYFVHRDDIEEGPLEKNNDVTFDIEQQPERGPKAVHVKKVV